MLYTIGSAPLTLQPFSGQWDGEKYVRYREDTAMAKQRSVFYWVIYAVTDSSQEEYVRQGSERL